MPEIQDDIKNAQSINTSWKHPMPYFGDFRRRRAGIEFDKKTTTYSNGEFICPHKYTSFYEPRKGFPLNGEIKLSYLNNSQPASPPSVFSLLHLDLFPIRHRPPPAVITAWDAIKTFPAPRTSLCRHTTRASTVVQFPCLLSGL